MYTTRNDTLRRRYDAITGDLRFRIEYDPTLAQPYVAYIDNRKILTAPYIGAAVEASARYVLARASRRRASGAASRQVHAAIMVRNQARPARRHRVKTNRLFGVSARRYNALKRLDAMTTADNAEAARKFFYNYFKANRI